MRIIISTLGLLFIFGCCFAQSTIIDSIQHNSITRTFQFYVPASYVPGQPVPLVIDLHGTGSNGAAHALRTDYMSIADTANFIIAYPDGTREPLTQLRFWNYGPPLSSNVDDVGFLEALIDSISSQYSINQNRIYCSGMSNGSFMSYYMACQSNRFAAVGGVTGSMSTAMYNSCNPQRPTPAIHVHGTDDNINPYTGTSSMQAVEDVTRFWVNQNSCDTTPVVFQIPDIDPADSCTAERFLYSNGVNGNTVEFFKVTNGGHTWPGHYIFTFNGNTNLDFNATAELWRFFSQFEIVVGVVEHRDDFQLSLLPNPSEGVIAVESGDRIVTGIAIYDLQGRLIETFVGEQIQYMDLRHLSNGTYIASLTGAGFSATRKLIISSQD